MTVELESVGVSVGGVPVSVGAGVEPVSAGADWVPGSVVDGSAARAIPYGCTTIIAITSNVAIKL